MRTAINKIHKLSDTDYALLLREIKPVNFKKGESILYAGQTCKGIYFVRAGVIGLYKIFKEREYYQDFFFENQFATNVISLTSEKPSAEDLIAVEDTQTYYLQKEQLLRLYDKSNDFREFGRKLLENLLAEKTQLSFIRSSLPAKEKYAYILQELPHYVQRLPMQVLASYLGFSRETLSRIRSQR